MLRFELRSLVSQTSQLTTIYMSHIKIPEELSCENLREPKICSTMFTISLWSTQSIFRLISHTTYATWLRATGLLMLLSMLEHKLHNSVSVILLFISLLFIWNLTSIFVIYLERSGKKSNLHPNVRTVSFYPLNYRSIIYKNHPKLLIWNSGCKNIPICYD